MEKHRNDMTYLDHVEKKGEDLNNYYISPKSKIQYAKVKKVSGKINDY